MEQSTKSIIKNNITIHEVENGYIVIETPDDSQRSHYLLLNNKKVFQSKKELVKFINEYFNFECKNRIKND